MPTTATPTTAMPTSTIPAPDTAPPRPVALLLPGQGAQRARMAAGLYGDDDAFTASMDEFFGLLGGEGVALRAAWLDGDPGADLADAVRAQPLLLAVNLALARMVYGWGVRPAALLGHSVGELAAAVLAGVFRLADAVDLMRHRMALFAAAPPGGMLAVAAGVAAVTPVLSPQVVIGAVNAPNQTVLAGPAYPLAEAARRLSEAGLVCRPVASSVAFHSPAAGHLVERSMALLSTLSLHPPDVPVYSAYTAGLLDARTATDPAFWARQLVDPVLFWPALDRLLAGPELPGLTVLDLSPGRALACRARRHPAVVSGRSEVLGLLAARPGEAADRDSVRAAARALRVPERAA
jgi:[acyl-carrier-protein] S-malonyltransferase